MPTLPDELFSLVEKSTLAAREAAEGAAQAALNTLAVNRPTPYDSMNEGARQLRRALRAKARQLGGGSQVQGLQPLVEEIAYQQWHRMLFARFLAENDLLMHPTGVPVTLQDCAELAPEEGEADAWAVAAKYASEMLPGIFRCDDPVVQVHFAPEGRLELERILDELPQSVFQADDSLGWMYQFWQSKKKEEVNNSGEKIGGSNLAPVTQLFTEDYIVCFLLENSLGAWWAARYPDSPLIQEWDYLRFKENGEPAAGAFLGWPEDVAEITVMDPCCGSGHFLVAAFEMLRKMRMEAEDLGEAQAANAVIHDNLFGLEIDPRCTQIAAFAVALAAWKAGGYRELPIPNIACSGIPVQGGLDSWIKLTGKDDQMRHGLTRLYHLFENAPTLGSLINPIAVPENERMFSADFEQVAPILDKALSFEESKRDNLAAIFGEAALEIVYASRLLSGKYNLVITNVPFLTSGKHDAVMQYFCERYFFESKADLATVFVSRCRSITEAGGTYAVVTPHDWRFLITYSEFRKHLLEDQIWNLVVNLGEKSFQTPMWDFNIGLSILTNGVPDNNHNMFGIDVSDQSTPIEKSSKLKSSPLVERKQRYQLLNPDYAIAFGANEVGILLSNFAQSFTGIQTGDDHRYRRCFWEIPRLTSSWRTYLNTVKETTFYGGREHILWWKNEGRIYENNEQAYIRGSKAWKKKGVSVSQMGNLPVTLYKGEAWIMNCASIIPLNPNHLTALWAFCSSPQFSTAIRKINQSKKVNPGYLVKIPFDLESWQKVAIEQYPNGLPEPYSNNPTQWLFGGFPAGSTDPLYVAVSRLLDYCWPEQKVDGLEVYADEDGIVCLTPVVGEAPAADRLRALLQATYGEAWSAQKQAELLAEVGFTGKTLRVWLRDGFFKQHCKLFKNRPFIWHIWDGRKDGFHALVNYHKLDAVTLDRLIYTYLGSWIKLQRDKRDLGEPGADGRLVAALELQEKLEAIREGEAFPEDAPPDQRYGYDIFLRWKSLAEQPIGWNPDLNDGVRLNIRPFVTAGVLRNKFTIHWKKDRGKNPDGSERHNDMHYTIAEKKAAR